MKKNYRKSPGRGRPPSAVVKSPVTMRLGALTLDRIQRFADVRRLDCTAAVETMILEYTLLLDGEAVCGRWDRRPKAGSGLKAWARAYRLRA